MQKILSPTWDQIYALTNVHLFDNYASFTNEIFGQLLQITAVMRLI